MNSITTKIKVAALIGLATLVSVALYVKADRVAADESFDSSYSIYADATTNLNAVMKAQPRANEYTSAEYMSKMAPDASQASEYLTLYENDSYQDDGGAYRKRTAPVMHQQAIKDGEPEPVGDTRKSKTLSSDLYGIRNPIVKGDTLAEEDQHEDPRLHVETSNKRRVISADGYSRDYSKSIRHAKANDDAYEIKDNTPYKVKTANEGYAIAQGYDKKDVPTTGINATPVRDGAPRREADSSYKGYAFKKIESQQTANLSQYDNAKDNDRAYRTQGTTPSSADMANTTDGFAKRKAPTTSTNIAPVKDYAQASPRTSQSQETVGGYAVKSRNDRSTPKATNMGATVDGYARRKAPSIGQQENNIAQYENASRNDDAYKASASTSSNDSYGGYPVRNPSKKQTSTPTAPSPRREYAQANDNNSYGGYPVRNPGSESRTVQTTPQRTRTTARGGVPASTGLKLYGNRGQRLAANSSQVNRTVIVMPKRGRSVKGTVIQDDPGKNIIVQSTAGVQSTYRYGEIDAVVTL